MTLHLSDYISAGEIVNTRRNSVHGYLALRGCDRPIVLQLTGNCSADLAGRRLRFEARPKSTDDPAVTEVDMNELQVGWIQIGVPGEMTTNRSPVGLYLEWFGQNGHTVIELMNPLIEFVEDDDEEDELAAEAEQALADADADPDDEDLEIDDLLDTGSQSASFEPIDALENEPWNRESTDEIAEDDEEDPFGLFPPDLNAKLGVASSWGTEPDEATVAQWKEWDEVFDGTRDVPLSSLFDPPIQLPPADSLDEQQVTQLFNTILIELARHNVAFHMCEHFTPRSGYVLLVEEILPQYGTHPELPRIGYTMNFDTAEHCEECDAEFERRYAERESRRNSEDPDSNPPEDDDDMPF